MRSSLDTFFSAWGEADAGRRREAIAGIMAQGFTYADPNAPGRITDSGALIDHVGAFSAGLPGGAAEVAGYTESAGYALASVDFLKDGERMMRGTYVADFDDVGNITLLVGFAGMEGAK